MRDIGQAIVAIFLLFSYKRESIDKPVPAEALQEEVGQAEVSRTEAISGYTTYTIRKGQHYSDKRPLKSISTSEMKIYARFDQTAIYQTIDPENQYDLNKLWGFSEGFNNQYNSARIGWRYSDSAIRLFGCVYSRGVVYYNEIRTVMPGEDIYCSIKIAGSSYRITAGGVSISLPRGATGTRASGLQ